MRAVRLYTSGNGCNCPLADAGNSQFHRQSGSGREPHLSMRRRRVFGRSLLLVVSDRVSAIAQSVGNGERRHSAGCREGAWPSDTEASRAVFVQEHRPVAVSDPRGLLRTDVPVGRLHLFPMLNRTDVCDADRNAISIAHSPGKRRIGSPDIVRGYLSRSGSDSSCERHSHDEDHRDLSQP